MSNNSSGKTSTPGLPGSGLKIIALIAMLIDHVAVSVYYPALASNRANFDMFGKLRMTPDVFFYYVLRAIGRVAFPIFIFLLIEGFFYTSNRYRYIGRMLFLALLSEIPFDLAFNLRKYEIRDNKFIEFGFQNVFLTLLIGLFVMLGFQVIEQVNISFVAKTWSFVFVTLIGMGLGYVLKVDYGYSGVLAIAVAYYFREDRLQQVAAICLSLILGSGLFEGFCILAILPILRYNNTRGSKIKWLFYFFYPVHLLILAVLKFLIY